MRGGQRVRYLNSLLFGGYGREAPPQRTSSAGNGFDSHQRKALDDVRVYAINNDCNAGSTIFAPYTLNAGCHLTSPDGRFLASVQTDGNFVVDQGGSALWTAGTYGSGANHVDMQSDGNLVVHSSGQQPEWASNTAGRGGNHLSLQSDGNPWSCTTAAAARSGQPTPAAIDAGGGREEGGALRNALLAGAPPHHGVLAHRIPL